MDRLPTRVDRSGQDWQRRREQNLALAADLKERLEAVKQGGGGKYVERHRSRGKMLPRERIAEICDPGSPFLELSSLAANKLMMVKPSRRNHYRNRFSSWSRMPIRCKRSHRKRGILLPYDGEEAYSSPRCCRSQQSPCIYLVDSGGASYRCKTRFSPTSVTLADFPEIKP
ncbi:MAG: hypothetical protein Ct9H90mP14_3260 [Methanobacteriota archaeon]|nr:MAG: hypothetical protein Ct9H90mP14_3260 [Euryarchaeota archaeon]